MNTYTFDFPEDGIICGRGDYLLCRHLNEWQVYRVEDILLVKCLVPRLTTPPTLILEEELLDSMAPAYFNEVQFLLSAFLPFSSELAALNAVQLQAMPE